MEQRAPGGSVEVPDRPCPASRELTVATAHDAGWLVLHVRGEIDLESQAQFTGLLTAAVSESANVIVDISGVPFMDSSGLAALVGAGRQAGVAGGELVVRNPQPITRRVLQISGVDQFVRVETDGASD